MASFSKTQSGFAKKFVSSFLRDSVNTQSSPAGAASLVRAMSIVRLFESPLQEVKVIEPNFDSYTAIRIDPYTLEEQLIMYPMVVVVHNQPVSSSVIIDVE